MKKRFLFFIIALIPIMSVFGANDESISILSIPKKNYDYFLKSLKKLIFEAKFEKQKNHFFIAKYKKDSKSTFLYWREGRRVTIISTGCDSQERWDWAILRARGGALILLDTGVVKTHKEVGSSSYLVCKAWISEVIYKCVVDGDMIVIEKNPVRPNKELGK